MRGLFEREKPYSKRFCDEIIFDQRGEPIVDSWSEQHLEHGDLVTFINYMDLQRLIFYQVECHKCNLTLELRFSGDMVDFYGVIEKPTFIRALA